MFGRTKRQAKKRLASAGTFLEWLSAARELDNLVGTTEWINEDDSPLYEKDLLIDLVISLERLRKENRIPELIKTLEDGLYRHHHDCINPSLYQETYSGESKVLPRRVLSEAAKTLNFLCDIPSSLYSDEAKLVQFKKSAKTFGRSALMLSGGATMGIYHLGVVKALHDADLLPRVISGSSMGAIVAAGICTRKRSQLDEFFRDPEQIHRTAMRFNSPGKILREGALFDPQMLLEHIRANLGGDFTFEEAYNISGLILNISVSPTRSRQKPKILNYLSSPNLLVTQSTMVSCAMPLLFRPGMLMARGAQGTPEPYLPTERWVDGTLGGDLPMARVSRLHNVNHYIVSQTNPHIYPLLSKSDEPSLAWLGADVARSLARSHAREVLGSARKYFSSRGGLRLLDQLHAITAQPYVGDINIHPRIDPWMLRKVISNPTMEDLHAFITGGERVTWPKIAMIRDHTLISRTFDACINRLTQRIAKNV